MRIHYVMLNSISIKMKCVTNVNQSVSIWLNDCRKTSVQQPRKNANLNRILRNFDVYFTAKHLLVETFDWQILEENELDCLHNCRLFKRLSKRLSLHCQNCNIWAMLLPDTRFAERESHNHFDAVSSWFHFLILFCCMQSTIRT